MSIAGDEQSGVFSISNGRESSSLNGKDNVAYTASTRDLPNVLFQKIQANQNSNNLGLAASDSEEDEADDANLAEVNCRDHDKRAALFCLDCSIYICMRCFKIHHSTHGAINTASMLDNTAVVTDAYTRYKKLAETYQDSLLKELCSLDITLSDALIDVEKTYEVILSRVLEKKLESLTKVKAVVSSQKDMIHEKLNNNQQIIDGYHDILEADSLKPIIEEKQLKHLPTSLVIPTTSLTTDVPITDLIIPDVKIKLSKTASSLPARETNSPKELQLKHVSTVGQKGTDLMEFKLPGGICLDRENNVYVADEGNNRIQKIGRDGKCLGTFTWGKCIITDVTYDWKSNKLLVPRAYNDHGLLKCSSFSTVTLDGEEVGRFVVPGMQGGLFISSGEDGRLLISDVVRKSVFLLKDGHVFLEIRNNQYLKQPGLSTFGKDGEMLIVDSSRKVVAVFDHNGLYIRDIGVAGNGKGELRKPCGISIDRSCGIVAVTDWCGDKIVLYSYQGSLLATTNGFKCPHSVAINDTHRLIVTDCWNNQLKVFSYANKN